MLIPCWNAAATIERALASVLDEHALPFECVVIDDGSTDGTAGYLAGLTDPRISHLALPHSGSEAVPRNAALRAARGEWVAFLDSDDLWLPVKLERQLAAVAGCPGCDWSYTAYALTNDRGERVSFPRAPFPQPLSGWILEPLLRHEATAGTPTLLVRRSLLVELGGFDEALPLRADYDLSLRLAASSEVCAVPEVLTLVREHGGRTTSQRSPAELFGLNVRVFRKAAAAAPTSAIRRLCRRQAAIQLAWRATALASDGAHRQALASLGRALFAAPLAREVWSAGARVAVRTVRTVRPIGGRALRGDGESPG
ncbi:MAG: glycosyltransferase family 2 protein [Gemmatimonadales bacterium]